MRSRYPSRYQPRSASRYAAATPLAFGDASGYNPVAALGADLLEYWDPEIPSQLSLSGSDVASWTSGKGLVLTEATNRPSLSATSIAGRPGVDSDGSADKLTSTGVGALPTGSATGEFWLVVDQRKPQSAGVVTRLFAWGNQGSTGVSRSFGITPSGGTNRVTMTSGTGAADYSVVGTQVAADGKLLIRGRWESDRIKLWVNNTLEGETLGTLGGTTTTRARLSAQANTAGAQFAQSGTGVMYATNLLSDDKAAALASYLAQRYGF